MQRQIENCERYQTCWRPAGGRRGFTLVEVLVVIAIISLLVGLLLPAIAMARRAAKRAKIRLEMTQLVAALEDFRTKVGGGQYPPDGTNTADTIRFIKAAFPRYAISNTQFYKDLTNPAMFTPDVALVFWLGGAQDSSGQFIGFSANPQNPFDDASASRIPPSYDFEKANASSTRYKNISAMTLPANVKSAGIVWNLYQFLPPNDQPSGAPYVYFKAVAGQYSPTPCQNTLPYIDSPVPTGTNPVSFVSPKTYQILCPGLDGKYGQYTKKSTWPDYPAGTRYDAVNGQDDMPSFTKGTVGDDTN